jgi:hypothetical protein
MALLALAQQHSTARAMSDGNLKAAMARTGQVAEPAQLALARKRWLLDHVETLDSTDVRRAVAISWLPVNAEHFSVRLRSRSCRCDVRRSACHHSWSLGSRSFTQTHRCVVCRRTRKEVEEWLALSREQVGVPSGGALAGRSAALLPHLLRLLDFQVAAATHEPEQVRRPHDVCLQPSMCTAMLAD